MNNIEKFQSPINKLVIHLAEHIDIEIAKNYFNRLCSNLDGKEKSNPKKDCFKDSKLRKYLETIERFELIAFLQDEFEASNTKFEKKYYYPALITYLNLTCFDQLGQNDFQSFKDWINKKRNDERDQFLNKLNNESKIEVIKKIHDEYIRIHGVKNKFTYFFEHILSQAQCEELMKHLIITDDYTPKNINVVTEHDGDLTIKNKIDYLYSVRNNYTHSVRSAYTAPETFSIEGKHEYVLYDEFYKNKSKFGVIKSREFDKLLKRCIVIGMANIIRKEQQIHEI